MLVNRIHLLSLFLIHGFCRGQQRTYVVYKPSWPKLNVYFKWSRIPSQYDSVQISFRQTNLSVVPVLSQVASRGERLVTFRIVGTGMVSFISLEGIILNVADGLISIEELPVEIPPEPPVNATVLGVQGQNLTLRITKQISENLVDDFIIRCFSFPESSCTDKVFAYRNDPTQNIQDVVIPNLQHGANYTFAVSTVSQGLNSTSSFITSRYKALKVPLPLADLIICEFPYKPAILLTLVKNRASIQDYFYVKCESSDEVEHECNKDEGLQVWDSQDPDENELYIPILELDRGARYTFSVRPISRGHVGEAVTIGNYELSGAGPTMEALRVNGTEFSTTTVHSDSIFHTHANGKAHIGHAKTEIPAEIAAASALTGLVVGILGTFLLAWLLTRNSSEPTDNQTDSTASVEPSSFQAAGQWQQQAAPRPAVAKSAPPLKKLTQSNRKLATETKFKNRHH